MNLKIKACVRAHRHADDCKSILDMFAVYQNVALLRQWQMRIDPDSLCVRRFWIRKDARRECVRMPSEIRELITRNQTYLGGDRAAETRAIQLVSRHSSDEMERQFAGKYRFQLGNHLISHPNGSRCCVYPIEYT